MEAIVSGVFVRLIADMMCSALSSELTAATEEVVKLPPLLLGMGIMNAFEGVVVNEGRRGGVVAVALSVNEGRRGNILLIVSVNEGRRGGVIEPALVTEERLGGVEELLVGEVGMTDEAYCRRDETETDGAAGAGAGAGVGISVLELRSACTAAERVWRGVVETALPLA